ncbi:MAG: nucleotidyltransferase family protein [Nitrososphaerota archaeon]|nr:nucleotidyltransferase family protein [Nitrososphaerota archaeon]MDG6952559.1 nucleotidyltransferase family protein [Nitrososphaerota archaeon]
MLHEFSPENNIKDYDLVYFDDSDLSYEVENMFIEEGLRCSRT